MPSGNSGKSIPSRAKARRKRPASMKYYISFALVALLAFQASAENSSGRAASENNALVPAGATKAVSRQSSRCSISSRACYGWCRRLGWYGCNPSCANRLVYCRGGCPWGTRCRGAGVCRVKCYRQYRLHRVCRYFRWYNRVYRWCYYRYYVYTVCYCPRLSSRVCSCKQDPQPSPYARRLATF